MRPNQKLVEQLNLVGGKLAIQFGHSLEMGSFDIPHRLVHTQRW